MLTNDKAIENACKIANDNNLTDGQKVEGILSSLDIKPKFGSLEEFDKFFNDPNSVLVL